MLYRNLHRKALATTIATICGLSITFSAVPSPVADASILGVVLNNGIQYIQFNKELNYYNNEGRDKFFDEMEKKYGVNTDEELNGRLDSIMKNLSNAIATVDPSINDKPYNYFINNDTSFNAFCTLGHNMSVNTGLFSLITNDDEIAVVLGHEMGHGQKDHPAKSFKKAIPFDLVAQIYADSQGGSFGSNLAASVFANYATATQVTKPQEWEADNLSFDYITHSPYNPGACAAIWQRVIEKQSSGSSENFVGEIFSPSDHPTNEQRRDNYSKKLTQYSHDKVIVKDGSVSINGREFMKPSATDSMSGTERSYFVAGNLAAVYHNNTTLPDAYAQNGTVMLGEQPILTPNGSDPDAETLATLLNNIK
jgi:beta-barrel assembly-enhancing protease